MGQPPIDMKKNFFQQIKLPQQKSLINGVVFPIVLSPNHHSAHLIHFIEAIKSHKEWLDDLLKNTGAILFRGFPVNSPSDFNDVIEATGFPGMEDIGGGAPREQVFGRVYTANESPPDQHIAFHHELANVDNFPSKVVLFCEVEPKEGGETPIVLSHIVYERMKETHPTFVALLEEHGLLYTRFISGDDDPTLPGGRGWRSTFFTNDKIIAEQRAEKVGMKLEWIDDDLDLVKITIGPKLAFRVDNARQSKTWFNSMVVNHTHAGSRPCKRDNTIIQFEPVTFGNGASLPDNVVYDCIKILEEECVAIPWKKGDILLLDNLAVMHGRRSIVNSEAHTRRILASICK
ncbi:hypothetical protein OSB04_004418 [Centaurea solstitialis]|uniref:TauD/TfdA-like domain-containing protein n=1 Tax=Centaurea solstitialis TaxID=347529 RepID=A0AA38UDF6_9ASTR|nr:hypothetical protein OSB04_004418 [Centaurea solstitialis]